MLLTQKIDDVSYGTLINNILLETGCWRLASHVSLIFVRRFVRLISKINMSNPFSFCKQCYTSSKQVRIQQIEVVQNTKEQV